MPRHLTLHPIAGAADSYRIVYWDTREQAEKCAREHAKLQPGAPVKIALLDPTMYVGEAREPIVREEPATGA